ncbi:MAG: aminoacyltransferase [Carboxylicivirga sp.]|nr:aminoacyltransferase [Carboxylicivirga sp.]
MQNQYNFTWTKEEDDIAAWDKFLKNDPRGHSQQVSHYLRSFTKYPFFNYDFLIVKTNQDKIIGGIGVLIFGIPYFKVLVALNGPIISMGHEIIFDDIIEQFLGKAKKNKAFYCQLKAPLLKKLDRSYSQYALWGFKKDSLFYSGEKGRKLSFIGGTKGFKCIRIEYREDISPYKNIWNGFNKNTKRNIKKAYSNKLELKYARTTQEVNEAYEIIKLVAKYQNYRLRPWSKMRSFLMDMIQDNLCIVPCCYSEGVMIGALIEFDIGRRLNYVYGGVLRNSQDLKVGHFLHNEMLKYSIERRYELYDLGVMGNEGVYQFKRGFGARKVEFENTRHWILNSFKQNLLLKSKRIIK